MSRLRDFGPLVSQPPLALMVRAALGAALALLLSGALMWVVTPQGALLDHPLLIAPFAASAVMMFAVPGSPLGQPWAVVVGNVLAAFCGVLVLVFVPHPLLGVALAEGLAIALMSLARALHPPAGGVAAYVVLAAVPGAAPDWSLLGTPVLLGSVLLVVFAWIWHRVTGATYPLASKP